jgi:pyruvate kinase
MRLHNTKFVCTLGPASEKADILEKMIKYGMDVARLNFSHGSPQHHAKLVKIVRRIAKKFGVPVAIMQDLQGPKIRIGKISDKGINVKKNEHIILSCGNPSSKKIPVQYKNLYKDVKKGNLLLIDDGSIELRITKIRGKDIYCRVLNDGNIKKNKGINVPDAKITAYPITPKDKKDLAFGLKQDIDYVALSFVKEAKNIRDLRKIITKHKKNVKIIAKIERIEAVGNLEEIIEASDGLMVARGDLAMEIGPEKVPIIQKKMIRLCNLAGTPVIKATHMLQSMVTNPQPTRAEVSDTANAIFDHSDAIMLSNETAVGKYPVRAIQMFAKIAQNTEKELKKHYELLPIRTVKHEVNLYDVIGYQTCQYAETINANNIIVVTNKGESARYISKHRSYISTIAITNNEKTKNQLALLWGLNKIILGKIREKSYIEDIKKLLTQNKCMKKGQKAVIFYAGSKEKHIVSTVI